MNDEELTNLIKTLVLGITQIATASAQIAISLEKLQQQDAELDIWTGLNDED